MEATVAPTPVPSPTDPVDPSVGCSAAVLKSVPSTTENSTIGEQIYSTVSCSFGRATNSAGLWYKLEGTGDEITASLCDFADFDTQMTVWEGDCSSLVCVGGSDDGCGLRSRVSWQSTLGQTYYVFVCKFLYLNFL